MKSVCDLVLPCKDEAAALRLLLPRIPDTFNVIVVDNGSTDDSGQVAADHGALVIQESIAGYGSAVHAGVTAATSEYLAVMDGDGSFDPEDLLPLLQDVVDGTATLATGRRRPIRRGLMPWHARAGNAVVIWWLRRRIALPIHDIAPMRVCKTADLRELAVQDRRFGYPVELLQKAQRAGWVITEHDVAYHPRAEGTRSKVSGSVRGTLRAAQDFAKALT